MTIGILETLDEHLEKFIWKIIASLWKRSTCLLWKVINEETNSWSFKVFKTDSMQLSLFYFIKSSLRLNKSFQTESSVEKGLRPSLSAQAGDCFRSVKV